MLSLIAFFIIVVAIKNAKLKRALAITTDVQVAVAQEAIDIPALAADKTIKSYQNNQSQQYSY